MNWDITPHLEDIGFICWRCKTSLEEVRTVSDYPTALHILNARIAIIEHLHRKLWSAEDIADFMYLTPETVEYCISLYKQRVERASKCPVVRLVLAFIKKDKS